MIVKILGIFDIISGILFWLSIFNIIPPAILMAVFFYLLIKGLLFVIWKDIASILDIISSIIIYLSLSFPMPKFAIVIITLFLIQKGIFSLMA